MRNMGRLFQYNRFGGNTDTDNNEKDNLTQRSLKTKEHQRPQPQFATNCPAYAELYPEYACTATAEATATAASTSSSSTVTTKSLELALRKYQQWSSKFLSTTATSAPAPAAESVVPCVFTHLSSANAEATTSSSQKSPNSCSYSAASSSGYHSRLAAFGGHSESTSSSHLMWHATQNEREELLVSAGKRPKVYDCMKDFLRRKLFQPRHEAPGNRITPQGKSDTEEDVTSDYDEVDILDSSYNADEEDLSDCSSNCTCPLESDNDDPFDLRNQQSGCNATPQKSLSPQKSLLSLNCWQNSVHYTDSTSDEEIETNDHSTAEDSDAGISDCCQLISEKSAMSPRKRSKTKKPRAARYNLQDEELPELLKSSWYQPRITMKAALERLQQSAPGTFLVRRKSRAYELCVRAESKVKFYMVQELADTYKLKGAKKQFTSLKALVTHHSVMAEQLPLTLVLPRDYASNGGEVANFGAPRSSKTMRRYADDFDTFESLQLLGLLQQLQHDEDCNEFS